jgi:hypothetical protein
VQCTRRCPQSANSGHSITSAARAKQRQQHGKSLVKTFAPSSSRTRIGLALWMTAYLHTFVRD